MLFTTTSTKLQVASSNDFAVGEQKAQEVSSYRSPSRQGLFVIMTVGLGKFHARLNICRRPPWDFLLMNFLNYEKTDCEPFS